MTPLPPPVAGPLPAPQNAATVLSDRSWDLLGLGSGSFVLAHPLAGTVVTVDAPSTAPAAPPSTTRSRRPDILREATRMFSERGYRASSLRDISRAVGISHPGMLHHFRSKDALLDEVIDDLEGHTREVMDQVDTIVRSGGDLSPLLWRELHREHRRGILFAVLSAESVDPEHPARFRISRLRLVYERMTENYLRAFAEKGQLRPGVDPVQASRALVSLLLSLPIRSATVGSLQSTPTDSPAEDIRALLELYLLPAPTGGTDSPSTPAD